MRPIILLDVDEVLADFESPYLRIVNEVAGLNIRPEDRTEWEVLATVPEEFHEAIRERAQEEGFCRNLAILPGAQDAVEKLRAIGQVYAVTSPWDGHKTWCWERTEWLKEHLGFKKTEVLHVSAKQIIRGNVFIDDRPDNLTEWAKFSRINCLALLWDRPFNRSNRDLMRVGSWDQVLRLLSTVYDGP